MEKAASLSIIEPICKEYHLPHLACIGNFSSAIAYEAGKRMAAHIEQGFIPLVLHIGDHDINGTDMSRDMSDRLALYSGYTIEVRRIALNMDQVRRYNLPPQRIKGLDEDGKKKVTKGVATRARKYFEQFGTKDCWEVDALSPDAIGEIIRTEVDGLIDRKKWNKAKRTERENKALLQRVADNWTNVTDTLEDM